MTADHLKFASDILRRLGEELIPHVDQGIVELVRNAYDADAVNCCVELVETEDAGGVVRVSDDGVGMTAPGIRNGWLVLGRSEKTKRQLTKLGRVPVGDKGLGRLAALRMGSAATLRTRPIDEPGIEYRLTLDWRLFDVAEIVEDVDLEIIPEPTTQPTGTTIEIDNLRVRLGRREVQRLARALLLLADPFDDLSGFHPILVAPAFQDLEKRVRESYFEDAEFRLVASLDNQGLAAAKVYDWSGTERWTANHDDLSRSRSTTSRVYKTSPATIELWAFNLNPQTFSPRASITELRDWLETVGGVHLYHHGLRVHPYGDPGYDWLDMNLARARSPELRPSTNTSIGRIQVSDPHEELVQKTDRSGFIENEAFVELRRFAIDALNWMANQRLREREARRARERATAVEGVSAAQANLDRAVAELPSGSRSGVQAAIRQLENAREQEAHTLREDLQLYRTLGTVGTTSAVFAHEAAKPVTQIEQMGRLIDRRGRKLLGQTYAETLQNPVDNVLRSARALKSYAALPLRLLLREKRRTGRIDIHGVACDVLNLFEPFLDDAQIHVSTEFSEEPPVIRGSVSAIEAILANLLTNAINAFDSEHSTCDRREVRIRTEFTGENLMLLRVLDNGPGIIGLSIDDIWLPGRSSRRGGTGLGLTIVRDTAADLGGRAYAVPKGELGGAEFLIELPLAQGRQK
jgi:signal transduction histidine kinase